MPPCLKILSQCHKNEHEFGEDLGERETKWEHQVLKVAASTGKVEGFLEEGFIGT